MGRRGWRRPFPSQRFGAHRGGEARAMDIEKVWLAWMLIVRRASDVLSMWVGMTQKNIEKNVRAGVELAETGQLGANSLTLYRLIMLISASMSGNESARDLFWKTPLALPPALRLVQKDSIVISARGPGGATTLDLAELEGPGAKVGLLVAHRVPLLARDVDKIRQRLLSVIDEQRRRDLALGKPSAAYSYPAIATDVAQPNAREACVRANVALFDRSGTAIVHAGAIFVHVEGHAKVERRPRLRLFGPKGARIVRVLLSAPAERRTAKSIAAAADLSFVFSYGVLGRLEHEGIVARVSPRTGFSLADAPRLLKNWIDSGERTAVVADGYYAPSTSPEKLRALWGRLGANDTARRAVFTLASALKPDEVFVSGLPHGIYVTGDAGPVIEVMGLRRVTPHNFFVCRADPISCAAHGGIFHAERELDHGGGIALPQLAVDFARAGGRGPEQADFLLDLYVKALPFSAELP